jgi:hypothetical protein
MGKSIWEIYLTDYIPASNSGYGIDKSGIVKYYMYLGVMFF